MNLRKIPDTEIEVTPVCLGTMTFGTPVVRGDAIKLTHFAIEAGINFIDTANIYEGYSRHIGSAGGVAEEILGEALAGKREQVALISKVGNAVGPSTDDTGLGKRHVMREIEKSLQRLRTDCVDFYLAHKPDPETPLEEIVETFNELIRAGKTRHWGVSNFSADEVEKLVAIACDSDLEPPRLSQPRYSMLTRDIEQDHLPACRQNEIGVTCYRVLESGLLSGKYHRGEAPPAGSRAAEKPEWVGLDNLDEITFGKIEAISAIAAQVGLTPAQLAVAWVIAQQGVTAAIVGVKREAQISDAVRAAQAPLSDDILAALDKIL